MSIDTDFKRAQVERLQYHLDRGVNCEGKPLSPLMRNYYRTRLGELQGAQNAKINEAT